MSPPSPPRRILLWVFLDTHFRELYRVATLLKRIGDEPVILFSYRYPNLELDIRRCNENCIEHHDISWQARSERGGTGAVGPRVPRPTRAPRVRLASHARRFVRRAVGSLLQRAFSRLLTASTAGGIYRAYAHDCAMAAELIDLHAPDLLVLPEDNVEYHTAALIQAAHERGVRSVILPYTIADALEPAEAYYNYQPHWFNPDRRMDRMTRRYFPHWLFRHRDRELLRLPWEHAFAQETLGIAPPLPWIINSGHADCIAIESEAVRDYYLRVGLPRGQLVVTGGLRQDTLAQFAQDAPAERLNLLRTLGLPEQRRLLLCALPPDQSPANRPGCEFATYRDLVVYWASTLGSLAGATVLVNPHPRTQVDTIRFVEEYGVRIVEGDIARLLPLCDVFVASVSATICMAVALGKPVINYDVYQFRYVDFLDVPAVRTMERREGFEEALRDLVGESGFNEASALAMKHRSRWGELDGRAEHRLCELFDVLTRERSAQR